MKHRQALVSAFIVSAMIVFSVGPLKAEIITFDDLESGLVPNGYAGLNWMNIGVEPGAFAGYGNGVISSPNIAFTQLNPAEIYTPFGVTFTLESLYVTAAWRNGLSVSFAGYLGGAGGTLEDSYLATVNSTGPTFLSLNWSGIDTVVITSSGGTLNPDFGAGPCCGEAGLNVVFDNITVTNETPLPAALPLFATGLGALGLLGWRKKRRAAA